MDGREDCEHDGIGFVDTSEIFATQETFSFESGAFGPDRAFRPQICTELRIKRIFFGAGFLLYGFLLFSDMTVIFLGLSGTAIFPG